MALFTVVKKSVALAAAGGLAYVQYKQGVWSDGDQSRKAWEKLKKTISTSSSSDRSKPVASALQLPYVPSPTINTMKLQWNSSMMSVFSGAAQAFGPQGITHWMQIKLNTLYKRVYNSMMADQGKQTTET
ncbi:uncharacterized protein LOC134187766 [Corticium candelabrum]|uniref:uncharacterized protein LOC134187766 n=1 Tax=Corticium candelabrum TaxID=121492 RepID=UPI002E26BB50|nr:uncharacterized protein LOC134187766 [Corticium candelabrum]